ncbi:MAG TPA: hypothetical protein VMN36_14600 [Verrucomicrobiales bacterium]|nr:hypothetical protein [Verrucomicrobiales bacterium]
MLRISGIDAAVFFAVLLASPRPGGATDRSAAYAVESIPGPPGVDAQVGGLDFLPDGRAAVCFHRGEVYWHEPAAGSWTRFAEGLHEPLGLVARSESEVLVLQRPELTRLIDGDGDGAAERYETLSDGFGITGNYHEFNYGPVRDGKGDLWISLNTASNAESIFEEVRGAFHPLGLPREAFYEDWPRNRDAAGRMFARVPYRGWVLRVDPATGALTPWACGFRSPNGLGFDLEGRLFVTDNQGDWVGSSKLHAVRRDGFYGHPASLLWRPGWDRDPVQIPIEELDGMREREAVLFPHGIAASSPTQPLVDATGGKFGPFAGQLFVGEMNRPRIMRVMIEEVSGRLQGACIPFLDGNGLRQGINRMAFAPDGSLWIGQSHLAWAGGEGVQRIRWTGEMPFEILEARLTRDGFRFRLTRPARGLEAGWKPGVQRYYYAYHPAYGSPQHDLTGVLVEKVDLLEDGRVIEVGLEELRAGYIYEIQLDGLLSDAGASLGHSVFWYTANRLLDGSLPPAQIPGVSRPEDPRSE